jgi:hypothetical protein
LYPFRLKGHEGKKEVRGAMAPGQGTVNKMAIETVRPALLSPPKCVISPNNSARRQESAQEDVGTKMHVMMAVDAPRRRSIETIELIELD